MGVLISRSPVTLEDVGSVPTVEISDLGRIIGESREAQRIWQSYPKADKSSIFRNLRSVLTDSVHRIESTVNSETGKPKADIISTEIMSSAATVRYCEDWLRSWNSTRKVDQGPLSGLLGILGRGSVIEYVPLGVIGVISPFNFPFAIPFTETAVAVAAGNAVIIKPSSKTPLSGHMIEDLFEAAGFPKGLVRAVSGCGVGEALSSSSVDKMVFTGGGEAGRSVMRACASNITPSVMELGGRDAMIVAYDADLERAASCAVWGSFVNSGQVCTGVKRIFVHESVFAGFEELLVSKTCELEQGDGWNDPDVSVGPLIDQAAVDSMSSVCERAVAAGGTILTGGCRNPDLKGYFFEPTVIKGLDPHSDIANGEIFGPIVMLFPFSSEDEAVAMANLGEFGLGSSVWTSDSERGRRMASGIRAGTTVINNASYTYGLPATPWGGRGGSGYGTTHGESGFIDMMHPHHVHSDKGRYRRDPWWMPYDSEKTETLEHMLKEVFCRGRMPLRLLMSVRCLMKGDAKR